MSASKSTVMPHTLYSLVKCFLRPFNVKAVESTLNANPESPATKSTLYNKPINMLFNLWEVYDSGVPPKMMSNPYIYAVRRIDITLNSCSSRKGRALEPDLEVTWVAGPGEQVWRVQVGVGLLGVSEGLT